MNIRLETEKDYFENENLTREAFWDVYRPGCSEHLVLHNLRSSSAFIKELDLVAEENGKLIGNIAYAKMYRDGTMCNNIICFGPVSVLPEMQKKGIGNKLINESLKMAKEMGFEVAADVNEALNMALEMTGRDAHIAVILDGVSVMIR